MSKILLLEPDILIARNIGAVLKLAGHEVDWHRDAQSAIIGVDKVRPDLIISELQLTSHSGIEFLYELRSYVEWRDIPLIVFSHVPNKQPKAEHWRELGVVTYHYKLTTKLGDLVASVDHVLAVV